jgi:hypothetical protein
MDRWGSELLAYYHIVASPPPDTLARALPHCRAHLIGNENHLHLAARYHIGTLASSNTHDDSVAICRDPSSLSPLSALWASEC